MNARTRSLLIVAVVMQLLLATSALAVSSGVVISQVYGGGGNSGATYKNDFIELFNRGASPVSLGGWSVQYASATGTTWQVTNLTGVTLQPGQYYLIQEAAGAGGTTNLPTPDATGSINMSGTAGKVALVNSTTAITSGTSCPTGASIIDFAGFGSTANCFEGTGPTPAPSNTTAILRGSNGCTDTDQNATDFTTAAPIPRNTATPLAPCSAPVPLSATGAANPTNVVSGGNVLLTVTVTPATTAPGPSTGITVTGDLSSIGGSATQSFFDDGTHGDVTPGDNIFTFGTTATGSVGGKSLPISVADAQARTASTSISLTIITITAIHDVQGNGDTSPLAGQTVSTRGIVTGVRSNGFFIELPDAQWDADPNTSEGIFVFTSSTPPAAAAVGNDVTVTGTVSEFIPSSDPYSPSQTELTSPTVTLNTTGNGMPSAITITTTDTNPAGSIRQLEKYAGMRVHVNTLNVVGPSGGTINEANATSTSNGTFHGVLPGIGKPFREPGIQAPDPIPNPPCCIPRFDLNPERIRVASNAIGGTTIDVTAGATVTNITGPLDYGFRTYTIDVEPATVPVVSGNVTFTAVPSPLATEFTVGSQNLERFFDDVNDSNGAVTLTTTAYNNRKNKASLLIRNVLHTPDILGVEEAETLTGLQGLAAKVNGDAVAAAQPNPNYTAYLLQGNDIGGINVGVLVNATRVTVNSVTQAAGSLTATYTDPTTGSPALIWDRPPLVVDATIIGPPAIPVVVIVNHLRSLSGIDDTTVSGASTNGDRVRQKRRAGAEWLANYIQGRITNNPNEKLVLVGDFNAFEFNDGYVDVMNTIKGTPTPSTNVLLSSSDLVNPDFTNLTDVSPAAEKYSYNFDGDAQSIDHILINQNAALNFTRIAHGRVDADFPEAYRNDSTRPERLSDHDGEVAYFSLAPTEHFDVTIPASVTSGVAFDGTVTVRDGLNNVVTNYNGTIHFTSSDGGATLPPDYTFNGGDAGTHTFSGGFVLGPPGSQSITATDTLNSAINGTGNTTVICPEMSVGAGNNGPICAGSTLQLNATSITGATYNWTGPNGYTATGSTPSISNATSAASGTYNVAINVAGCIYNASTSATVDAAPTAPTISADTNGTGTQDQACPEVPLTLHANGATGATSYQWYKDIDALTGETGATYQATGSATYYVAAINGSCSIKSAGYVVQNPTPHSPFVSFRNQDSSITTLHICQGSSQIVDSDSATGIHWWVDGVDQGPGNQSYTFTSSSPSTHTFTAQLDALGCHSQFGRTVTIIVDAMPPTPTISGDTNGTGTQDQACPEQPLTLHANGATGATSYTWYSDNAVIPNETTDTIVVTYVVNLSVTATNGTCTTPHSATYVVQNPTPHAGFISFRNQASNVTSLAMCVGQSQIIDSDSATGIQWYEDTGSGLVAIPGAGSQSYTFNATTPGTYMFTAQLDALGCHSQFGRIVTITVNPVPATPTVNAGGPTTFCAGGSVTLTSSAASGNQWKLNGSPIGGATGQTYNATATGSYTVTVTDGNGCTATSSATAVTANPLPATPTIGAGGPTTFCAGGSVTLTSSAASGNQWNLNGVPIGGATSQTYVASTAGDYTVVVTNGNGCVSATSAATTVTINPNPNATITAPSSVVTGSTGNPASVASAGAGATYNWSITNGTITAGTGTNAITFTAGAVGTLTLQVTVTTSAGCSDTKSANVTVALPLVTVTAVNPAHGSVNGGLPVTITGTGFKTGATVTFGGTTATNIVFVNATTITAKTPAHAGGAVNVTVTNTDTSNGTLTNGFTYVPQRFDPNGDGTIDPSDIFYLVNWLFTNGPAPAGTAGMMSGDANGDGVVDPSDIFFVVNYLFDGGYAPQTIRPVSDGNAAPLSGTVSLGTPFTRDGRTIVPVIVNSDSAVSSLSLRLTFDRDVQVESVRRTTGMQPSFEINRASSSSLAYLVTYGGGAIKSGIVAEIELAKSDEPLAIAIDPALTLLSDGGVHSATVGNGRLTVQGTTAGAADHDKSRDREN